MKLIPQGLLTDRTLAATLWMVFAVAPVVSAGAGTGVLATESALPGNTSLSVETAHSADDFSIYHMAVVDQFGVIGSGFATSNDPRLRPLTRLDSSWTFAAPMLHLPARVGDGVSSAGFWDAPVRLGGLQIGTFQPAAPDVVLPPSLSGPPDLIVGAAGLASASTRIIDHLHTQVLLQKQTLASAGAADYSLEAGRQRDNFELRSNDYGHWLTSGTYRYGVNSLTTVDGQFAQVAGHQTVLGLGVLEGLGPFGLLSARVGSSRDTEASGWIARMAYDFTRNNINIALRSHVQSAGFQAAGDSAALEPLRARTLASAGLDMGSLGRVSVASATQTYVDYSRRDIVALSHAMPISGGGIFSTAAAYSPGPAGNSALLLSVTYPFDYIASPKRTLNGTVDYALDKTIDAAMSQIRLPAGNRYGSAPYLQE